jgi:hypothetical protein
MARFLIRARWGVATEFGGSQEIRTTMAQQEGAVWDYSH